jgi:hypothetical protein
LKTGFWKSWSRVTWFASLKSRCWPNRHFIVQIDWPPSRWKAVVSTTHHYLVVNGEHFSIIALRLSAIVLYIFLTSSDQLYGWMGIKWLPSNATCNISPFIITQVLVAYSRNSCIYFTKQICALELSMSDDNKQPGVFAGSWRLAIIMLIILAGIWMLGRAFA